MKANRCRLVVIVAFATFAFADSASAELKRIGTPAVDMVLPGGTASHIVYGHSSYLSVDESSGVIQVTVQLDCIAHDGSHTSCLDTGIELRNRQMWKYLEADKFPDASLSTLRSQLKLPIANDVVDSDATGKLSLHGAQRTLIFHYTARREGSDIDVLGNITVSLKDFNVERPTFFGVHTGMYAKIRVHFMLRDS